MATNGFYKKSDTGELLYAPNRVTTPSKSLIVSIEKKKMQKEHVALDDWKYFEAEDEAIIEYDIKPKEIICCPMCQYEWDNKEVEEAK